MATLANTKMFTKEEILNKVQTYAEELFRNGTLYCSESVVQIINELLGSPYDENIVKLAGGFPVGMGHAGCSCGAVSGGQMALGMVYGRVKGEPMNDKMFGMSKDLHDYVVSQYKSICCRVITKEWKGDEFKSEGRKNHCIAITGDVTKWITNRLIEDEQIEVKA